MEIVRIGGRFRLQERLPSGSSRTSTKGHSPIFDSQTWVKDDIYFARDIFSGETVVLKLEPLKGKERTLEHEFYVYKKLNKGTGIPVVHWFGTESGFDVMAVDRLGPSLQDLFVRSSLQFTMKTVLLLARQLVSKFEL